MQNKSIKNDFMENENPELTQIIRTYIYNRYGRYINENNYIWYGQASFSVDMLLSGSVDTCRLNPDKDPGEIVDNMFDYFCT